MELRVSVAATLLLLGLCFASVQCILIGALNTSLNLPSSNLTLSDLTLNKDSLLRIRGSYGNTYLDANSCQMTAVDSLAFLATHEHNESIPGMEGRLDDPRFAGTLILILPAPPAREIEIRFAVEALYRVMYDMTVKQQFKDGKFDLFFQDNRVGTIGFLPTPTMESQTDNSLAGLSEPFLSTNATPPVLTNLIVTASSDHTTNDWEVDYSFIPDGSAISIYQFFITVLATLRYVAQFPTHDVVSSFQVSAADIDCRMDIWCHKRSSAPYYDYLWVIEAVRQGPEWMLLNEHCAEARFLLDFDSIELGYGFIRKGKAPDELVESDGAVSS